MALRDADLFHIVNSPHEFTISWADLKAEVAAAVAAAGVGVESLSHTVVAATLSDGTAAVGTSEFPLTLPLGARVLFTDVKVTAGFAGDVSATVQVGDEGDPDRFSEGTPSCFATAADGIQMGTPSGAEYCDAETVAVVSVTSATDITLVIAAAEGAMTVTIYYVRTV